MACEWAPVYVVPVNEVPANGVYEREPCSGGCSYIAVSYTHLTLPTILRV